MTEKEAIKELKEDKSLYETEICQAGDGTPDGDLIMALDMGISALEKQIPKKVKKEILTSNAFTQWRKYNCPNCGYFLYSGSSAPFSSQSYCHQCGQKLDFGE